MKRRPTSLTYCFAAVFAVGALAAFTTPASADELNTKLLVSNCYVCHGPGGKTAGHTPRLNNQTAEKVEEALTLFSKGEKAATIMNRIAKGYSADQIKVIAKHIGAMNAMQ